jgi:hypothetical protein
VGNKRGEAALPASLTGVQDMRRRSDLAEECAAKAIRHDDGLMHVRILLALSDPHLGEAGDPHGGIRHAEQALDLARGMNDPVNAARAPDRLSRLRAAAGDHDAAAGADREATATRAKIGRGRAGARPILARGRERQVRYLQVMCAVPRKPVHLHVLYAGLSRGCVIVVCPAVPFELYDAFVTFESEYRYTAVVVPELTLPPVSDR